jgi:hypothetical protein
MVDGVGDGGGFSVRRLLALGDATVSGDVQYWILRVRVDRGRRWLR